MSDKLRDAVTVIRNPFGPDDTEDEESDETRVVVAEQVRETDKILTQHIVFSGGYETTISFSKKMSSYHDPWSAGHDTVPEVPVEFDGTELPSVNRDQVATVEVVDSDKVAYTKRVTREVSADEFEENRDQYELVRVVDDG